MLLLTRKCSFAQNVIYKNTVFSYFNVVLAYIYWHNVEGNVCIV